jgi:hypothetical protein
MYALVEIVLAPHAEGGERPYAPFFSAMISVGVVLLRTSVAGLGNQQLGIAFVHSWRLVKVGANQVWLPG